MASEKILFCCLILAWFVSMAKADASTSEKVTFWKETEGFESDYASYCAPDLRVPTDRQDAYLWYHFFDCFSYSGHKYYLSKEFYRTVKQAQKICHSVGGYIVQINTMSEFQAIKNYLGNITKAGDYHNILIDGTDVWEEGTWTFFDLTPLPVIDWYPGTPDGGDCLCLSARKGKMFDVLCFVPYDMQGDRYPYRFMCEITA